RWSVKQLFVARLVFLPLTSMSSLPSSPFSSPFSSPSLGAVDSSPPSSPTLAPLSTSQTSPGPAHPFAGSTKAVKPLPLYEKRGTKRPRAHTRWADEVDSDYESQDVFIDETPPRRVGHRNSGWNPDLRAHAQVLTDPFAASAKHEWIPPVREKKAKTHSRSTSDASSVRDFFGSSSAGGSALQDAAYGVLGTVFTYIPPSIGDLAKLVLLKDDDRPVLRPPSRRSGTPEPNTGCNPGKRVFTRALTVPSCQPGQSIFDYAPPKTSKVKYKNAAQVPLIVSTNRVYEMTEIQLLLEKNAIARLPLELFSVISLTVLNLRNNMLQEIPPQIAQLIHLQELNVKNNQLRYLPAEMLGMRLQTLEIEPNPWMTTMELAGTEYGVEGSASHFLHCIRSQPGRLARFVSNTKTSFTAAPLSEYCLRVLLAPHPTEEPVPTLATFLTPSTSSMALDLEGETQVQSPPWPHYRTNLETHYELPLSSHDKWPAHVLDTLRGCLPKSVARPDTRTHVQGQAISPGNRARQSRPVFIHEEIFSFSPPTNSALVPQTPPHAAGLPMFDTGGAGTDPENEEHDTGVLRTGVSVCPSPGHVPRYSRVFVKHAEERYSWEHSIAGCDVDPPHGVPVHWRGCSPGCLRFLDTKTETTEEAHMDYAVNLPSNTGTMDEMDIDFDMADSQSENGFGVEAMDLSGGLDDFD
ncbi:hypothetical protein EIP86_000002, partial [Pleurotus ostreatoroseus]